MAEIPEEILRRSAEAKAKATGRDVEEILAELKSEAAAEAAAAPEAAAAAAPDAPAGDDSLRAKAQRTAAALPDHLLRRSAEAKAKALGVPVEQVIAELTGGGAPEAPAESAAPAAAAPAPATDPNAPIDWEAAAAKAGIPEKLLHRSLEAKAKASDRDEMEVLADMIGDIPRIVEDAAPGPASAPEPAPAEPALAPAPAAAAPAGEIDWEAAAAAAGMSAKLLQRSAEAKAKATDKPIAEILAEMGVAVPTPSAAEPAPAAPAPAPAAAAPAGEIDWEAAAAAAGMSAKLLQRSAEAKAKATDKPIAEILAEMGVAVPTPSAAEPAPAAPAPAPAAAAPAGEIDWEAAAAAAGMSAKLLQRSAEAKAKATDKPIAEILAEMGVAVPTPSAAEPAPAAPAPAPAAAAPAGEIDWVAAASTAGLPETVFKRSAEARAKASGRPIGEIVAELTGTPVAVPEATAPAAAAPPAAPAAAPATTVATAPSPSLPPVPDGVDTQRLLTVVQAKAIQGAKREPVDKVSVWPHLLAIEFVALLVVTALLVIFSVFQDAPLLELANPNAQPNPSKAPWYFLGLQELLSYFDPQVAGVLIPGLGLAGLAIFPYIDRNPSTRPNDRKFAIMLFTFFVVASAILTIIGSFYRGKGFNFTFPWRDGIFFDL